MKKCYCYTFYNENHNTYLYITCNKKILFVKKYLSLLWVFTDFFLLLSENKHCDNAATNWNSENARSRMVASGGAVYLSEVSALPLKKKKEGL